MTNPTNPFGRQPPPTGAWDPFSYGNRAEDNGSLLQSIAAKIPGVEYHPASGQLGSYGHGPLGEPTFEPFHPAYVDWLVKRTLETGAANGPRPLAAQNFKMEQPAPDAASASNDTSAIAGRDSSSWGGPVDLDRNMLIDVADRRSGPSNPWQLNPLESVKVESFRRVVNKPTRDNIDQISGSMFGRDFPPRQRRAIMDYMIAKTRPDDLWKLKDVAGDTRSVTMSLKQKQIIDGMIRRLPNDPLGARARQAYDQAIKQGFVRIQR